MRLPVLVLSMLLSTLACLPAAADDGQAEIEWLLRQLVQSDCRFQRNGKWYDAARAATHLRRKYEVYLRRSDAPHAEEFIAAAASHSSLSGRPYRVKCGAREIDSRDWFDAQLKMLRDGAR